MAAVAAVPSTPGRGSMNPNVSSEGGRILVPWFEPFAGIFAVNRSLY
jgi:hypothetical protein